MQWDIIQFVTPTIRTYKYMCMVSAYCYVFRRPNAMCMEPHKYLKQRIMIQFVVLKYLMSSYNRSFVKMYRYKNTGRHGVTSDTNVQQRHWDSLKPRTLCSVRKIKTFGEVQRIINSKCYILSSGSFGMNRISRQNTFESAVYWWISNCFIITASIFICNVGAWTNLILLGVGNLNGAGLRQNFKISLLKGGTYKITPKLKYIVFYMPLSPKGNWASIESLVKMSLRVVNKYINILSVF